MKVIIVTDYAMVNGGAGKVALESAIALADHVETVHVFASIGDASEALTAKPNLRVTQLNQTKITDQSMSKSIIGGLWNKEVEQAFSKVLDLYDPKDTIVHVHSWRDGTTLSFIPEVLKRNFPLVFTAHDFGLACPIAGFFDYRTNSPCHLKGMSAKCLMTNCTDTSIIKKSWFSLRHFLQQHRADIPSRLPHLITVSKMSEDLLWPYLSEQTQVHHVPNPIAVTKAPRVAAESNLKFAFVGRYSTEKAPLLAAKAAQAAGVPIMFIGAGPLASGIKRTSPEAEELGWRRPEEVQELLRQARAVIFPSVWYEAQGMVVDEAAAMGIPVIVSDVTAAQEAVSRYQHGTVFESGNLDSLVQSIQKFDDDERVKALSQSGYSRYWSEPKDMDNHIQHLMKVYSSVATGSRL